MTVFKDLSAHYIPFSCSVILCRQSDLSYHSFSLSVTCIQTSFIFFPIALHAFSQDGPGVSAISRIYLWCGKCVN